jgi:single-strand DNA-binding protein
MAGGINKVILVGNLGQDPEIKNFDNGGKLAQFSVATSESYKDPKSGEKVTQTEWHRVVIKRPALAGIAEQYLRKGMQVYIEGKIKTRSYQTKENETRYVTEVVVEDFQMLTPRSQGETSPESHDVSQAPVPPVSVEDDLPF